MYFRYQKGNKKNLWMIGRPKGGYRRVTGNHLIDMKSDVRRLAPLLHGQIVHVFEELCRKSMTVNHRINGTSEDLKLINAKNNCIDFMLLDWEPELNTDENCHKETNRRVRVHKGPNKRHRVWPKAFCLQNYADEKNPSHKSFTGWVVDEQNLRVERIRRAADLPESPPDLPPTPEPQEEKPPKKPSKDDIDYQKLVSDVQARVEANRVEAEERRRRNAELNAKSDARNKANRLIFEEHKRQLKELELKDKKKTISV